MTTLADLIIEWGVGGEDDRLLRDIADMLDRGAREGRIQRINELRGELLELRQLRAAAEARKRYTVEGWGGDVKLLHECRQVLRIEERQTLADLVQRADSHTEGCR